MSTAKQTTITDYNPKAFKEIDKDLFFSTNENEPVIKQITYSDFECIGSDLKTILNAIEIIGFNGHPSDLALCACLAGIAQKLVPSDELDFLDRLLIKTDKNKNDFIEIKK
ncbi:hypothetical protein [Flavobacterium chilense]|uniref:Uncharacterized protein n=1 Tax=Flavobacterium chilense TaxID=946677 RepID=A0A1M7DQU0_9FLAO|nr:hypothetical protein [Flavobacterium chilense]SHL81529.1 hypothetical protein SAMN05444484_102671 [Flavobacterium chilense]